MRGLTTWSTDVVADDWKHITASEVVRRAISRLDEKGKGILLLHDIQPATALALPELLRELKAKGYRIVLVAPGKGPAPVAAKPVAPAAAPAAPEAPAVLPAAAAVAASAPPAAAAPPAPRGDAAEASPKPKVPAAAADSMARGEDIPQDPARPFTSGSRPARNMPTPDKFVTTKPGGWPHTVSVPVPRAVGIGVSSSSRTSQTPDGRFQQR